MVIIALFLLSIALSFLNKNYWLYQFSVYSLVALAFVINYTIQLYFTLQVKKSKSRYLPNIAFWAINFATELIQIIVVQVIELLFRNSSRIPRSLLSLKYSSAYSTPFSSSSRSSSTKMIKPPILKYSVSKY